MDKIEISRELEEELSGMQKYLKKKAGIHVTKEDVMWLALGLAKSVGGYWGFLCKWKNEGGIKKWK